MGELKVGIKNQECQVVKEEHTACALASGMVAVLSTPMLIALMEKAAMNAVAPYLEEGMQTVGTDIKMEHLAATPVGMQFRAEAILMEINGRKLVFAIETFDEIEKIGQGTHERFIVSEKKFMDRVNKKNGTSC